MKLVMVLFSICLMTPDFAQAYLDPGTGAMVMQIVVAIFAGAIAFTKLYWNKISTWIKQKRGLAPFQATQNKSDTTETTSPSNITQ